MAKAAEAKVSGKAELIRNLSNMSKAVADEMKPAFEKAALRVVAEAKKNCTPGLTPYARAPFRTGNLRRSITYDLMFTNEEYKCVVGTIVPYAIYVHDFGTKNIPPRPFLLDAVIAKQDVVIKILAEAYAQAAAKCCKTVENLPGSGGDTYDFKSE